MKYLTPEQVEARARGPRSALKVSIQKHKQQAKMPKEDFPGKVEIWSDTCGLCVLYDSNCDLCPLGKEHPCNGNDSLWWPLSSACGRKRYDAFIEAEENMVKALESLLEIHNVKQ